MRKLFVPVMGKKLSPEQRQKRERHATAKPSETREYLPGAEFEPITPDRDGETLCRFYDGSEWWIPTDKMP